MRTDHARDERHLVTGALRALAVLAVPAAGLGALAAGVAGALGAVTGLALVALLFAGAAGLLCLVADRRPTTALAVMISGIPARLLAYAAILNALGGSGRVHGPSLAAATVLGIAITLAVELRLLASTPRLFWVEPDRVRPQAVINATRSQPL